MNSLWRRLRFEFIAVLFILVILPVAKPILVRADAYVIAASDATASEKAGANVVCTGAGDQTAINKVLTNNRTVTLTSGHYRISGSITFNSLSNVTLNGSSGGKSYIVRSSNTNAILISGSSSITVNNIDFSNTGTDTTGTIWIIGSDTVWITNNTIHNVYWGVEAHANTSTHVKSTNIHINNNEIYAYSYIGIEFGNGVKYGEALNNNIHNGVAADVNLYGICCEKPGELDTVSPYVENITISNNTISNQSKYHLIDVEGGYHITISNNTLSTVSDTTDGTAIYMHANKDSGYSGVSVFNDYNVTNNTVSGCVYGILQESDQLGIDGFTISGNKVSGYTYRGIDVIADGAPSEYFTNGTISGNVLSGSTGKYAYSTGIRLQAQSSSGPSGYVTIFGNSIDGNSNLYEGLETSVDLPVQIYNNVISGCLNGNTPGGAYTISASAGSGGSISPSGAVSVNPGASQAFAITANSGYSIGSVLVDGVSQGAITSYTFTNVVANSHYQRHFHPQSSLWCHVHHYG